MRRGTTPTISFTLPFDSSVISEIWLTIAQRSKEVLTKKKADMKIDGSMVSVQLTQQETLALDDYADIEIQARLKTTGGEAFASNILRVSVDAILKDGEI